MSASTELLREEIEKLTKEIENEQDLGDVSEKKIRLQELNQRFLSLVESSNSSSNILKG